MSASRFLLTLELDIPLPWTDQDHPPGVRHKTTRKLRVRMPFPDENGPKTREEWIAHTAAEIRHDIAQSESIESMVGTLMDRARGDGKDPVRWEQDAKDHWSCVVGGKVRATCWHGPGGSWQWEVWEDDPDNPVELGRAESFVLAREKAEEALRGENRG